jgi:short-subunit dehydrogenase involved in D-alanine esterification of teichoic acids
MSSSTPSTLSFKKAIITGGAGGLGRAMAESLIKQGKRVIIVGRTESKLKEAAEQIGAETYYILDTSDNSSIPEFVKKVTTEHPDVDCLINNAGVQRPFQFPGAGSDYPFDLGKADAEINTNIRGPMHLTLHLLPHFQKQESGVIMNVSSILGFNPTTLINPVYNGTKAWLHSFTLNLRTELANSQQRIKVVEIAPPSVETDLHRERKDPDDNKRAAGNKIAMTVPEFMAEVEQGWKEDADIIAPGRAGAVVAKWYEAYGKGYSMATSKATRL